MAKKMYTNYLREKKKQAVHELSKLSKAGLIKHIIELRHVIDEKNKELLIAGSKQRNTKEKTRVFTKKAFKREWTYPVKVTFLLNLCKKPLTSNDLYLLLKELDKPSALNCLLVVLNREVKLGRLRKLKLRGQIAYFYLLPEWVEPGGDIKPEYSSGINKFSRSHELW